MSDNAVEVLPYKPNEVSNTVKEFESGLNSFLDSLGLPTDRVLVAIPERLKVIRNMPDIAGSLSLQQLAKSLYISKFVAACSAGLFDAALNFLWNETVSNLRRKVASFDLEYFYDSIVSDPKRRSTLKDDKDLAKLDDWELMKGCASTGLVSDIGYRHLDYIREMRNFASAAHPNQNELSGLQVVSWLETCINEVLSKEPEGPVIEVRKLLNNIREQTLKKEDVAPIANCLDKLPKEILHSLLRATVGMYSDPKIAAHTRNNITLISKDLWDLCGDEPRQEVGLKCATLSANGDVSRKTLVNQFLQSVNGLSYLPIDARAVEINASLKALANAHNGYNNFYTEIPHATMLAAYIPETGLVPTNVETSYVRTLVICRAGNYYGTSAGAQPTYDELISKFSAKYIKIFLCLLAEDQELISAMQNERPSNVCKEIATQMIPRATDDNIKTLLGDVARFNGRLSEIGKGHKFAAAIRALYTKKR